jgi:hypothetical protein
MRYILNQSPIEAIEVFAPPTAEDFPAITCKNVHWDRIREDASPYVNRILARMNALIDRSPSANKRYRFVDVKVHDLSLGDETANGWWHLDSSLNPVNEYDNLLFVTGQMALTEFVSNPIEIEHQQSGASFHKAICAQPSLQIERVPSCTLVRYNGSNVHRGPRALGAERRLLIRLVTTDHVLPSGRVKYDR